MDDGIVVRMDLGMREQGNERKRERESKSKRDQKKGRKRKTGEKNKQNEKQNGKHVRDDLVWDGSNTQSVDGD